MKTDLFCVILGGGGHARVLVDCLQGAAKPQRCVILDADRSLWGTDLLGVTIQGDDRLLPNLVQEGANAFVVGVGSTGDNRPRQRLYELGLSHGLKPLTIVHPRAICSPGAAVGAGVQLLPGCIVNAGARLGNNVIVNSGAIVEHDCLIEDHVHVATGARIASTVRVGRLAHIGIGATVRECRRIGEEAIIGAGAVVIQDVPSNTTVMGVPARPKVFSL